MSYKKWNANKCYDGLDKSGKFHHANGVLPDGAIVKHHLDKSDTGAVIHSNQERSLVNFSSGREWYPNSDLLVRNE